MPGWLRPASIFALTAALVCALHPARTEPLAQGGEAPVFYLSTLNEKSSGVKRVVLEKLVGPRAESPKRALWLVFFDADCQPCRRLLPEMQALRQQLSSCDLEVVGVDCDSAREKIDTVAKLIEDLSVGFPVVVDRFGALARRYQVESFPTMFLLDRGGKIHQVQEGFHPEKKPVPLDGLRQLLDLPAGPPKCPSEKGGSR